MGVAAGIPAIRFDRGKYGRPLRVDANDLRRLDRFITTPHPHRLQFHEIVLLRGGRGSVEIDGVSIALQPGRVCCAAPGEVRRWRLETPLAGYVVCFEADFLDEFFAASGFLDGFAFFAPGGCRSLDLDGPALRRVTDVIQAMADEVQALQADSDPLLRARLHLLLVELGRAVRDGSAASGQRALLRRFRALVERDFRSAHGVGAYAASLGVSTHRLNAAVQRAVGRSASSVLHGRLLLEARRLLLYTDLPAADIAARLGFADASYFHRFFKQRVGTTPQRLRAGHEKSSPGAAL